MLSAEKEFLVDFFALEPSDIEDISYVRDSNNRAVLRIILTNSHDPCPDCGCQFPRVKEYIPKKIKYTDGSGRDCILLYHARRFVCPECRRTYYEPSPFVQKRGKIASRVVFDILKSLKNYNATLTSVARQYNVSPTTVAAIFDSHVEISRKRLPRILCIDEVYAMKTSGSKYVCLLLDFEKQTPVDLLPDRYLENLRSYMFAIPAEERETVEVVCFDMYKTYRTIAQEAFPNAVGVVDRFHVIQEFTRKVSAVRIRVMNRMARKRQELKEEMRAIEADYSNRRYEFDPVWQEVHRRFCRADDQYYVLKKFNWLLCKDEDSPYLSLDREGQFNRHFNRNMALPELREILLGTDPELEEAVRLRRVLTRMYEDGTYDEAGKRLYNQTYLQFRKSTVNEMRAFSKTLKEWSQEIINSFRVLSYECMIGRQGEYQTKRVRVHNGIIENRNKIIKCMKHNAYGFTNWHRFRNRMMYVLDPQAGYSLEPRYQSKAQKK